MVQIHGGGYTIGSAQSYPGDALVNASDGEFMDPIIDLLGWWTDRMVGNLIYVSMQYRLGIFGFLSGSPVAQH